VKQGGATFATIPAPGDGYRGARTRETFGDGMAARGTPRQTGRRTPPSGALGDHGLAALYPDPAFTADGQNSGRLRRLTREVARRARALGRVVGGPTKYKPVTAVREPPCGAASLKDRGPIWCGKGQGPWEWASRSPGARRTVGLLEAAPGSPDCFSNFEGNQVGLRRPGTRSHGRHRGETRVWLAKRRGGRRLPPAGAC